MQDKYIPTYKSTLSDQQMVSLTLAVDAALKAYVVQGFTIDDAHSDSHIGTLRDLLENLRAIRCGNRRGGKNPFDIVMVKNETVQS